MKEIGTTDEASYENGDRTPLSKLTEHLIATVIDAYEEARTRQHAEDTKRGIARAKQRRAAPLMPVTADTSNKQRK